MKKLFWGLAMVLGVLVAGGKVEASTYVNSGNVDWDVTDVTYEVTYDYTEAYKLANKIIEERAKLGTQKLEVSEALMRTAMNKAAILNWEFSHSPSVIDEVLVDGEWYTSEPAIITTSGKAEEAYLNFYNSPAHKKWMLEEQISHDSDTGYFGVGVVNGYTCVAFKGKNKGISVRTLNCDAIKHQTTGNVLTNYTELYTLHVNNATMTPEKWGTIGSGSTDLEVGGTEDWSMVGMDYSAANSWGSRSLSYHAFDFSISDPNVIKVENGKVTAVGEGTATLTIKLKNTNVVGTITYKVTDPEKKESKPVKLKKVSNLKIKRYKIKGHKTWLGVSWKGIKGVKSYNVQVAKDKKFKKLLVNKKYTGYTSAGITKKFKGKKVYVRVRAVNGKNTGPWSKVKAIKTYK